MAKTSGGGPSEGPQPACVQTPGQGELTEKTSLPARVSGRHVVRGGQSSPNLAQQPAFVGGSKEVRQRDRQGW